MSSSKWQFAIQEISSVKELIGKSLSDWKVEEVTEVRQNDVEGRSSTPVGYFRDPDVAEVFAGPKDVMGSMFARKVLALTDGKAAFLIGEEEPLNMFDDEAEAGRLRKEAADKLSPAERKLLGL
jgi:hypothetical protein